LVDIFIKMISENSNFICLIKINSRFW